MNDKHETDEIIAKLQAEDKDIPIFTIEVDVFDVSDQMLMARAIGEGSYKDEPLELITAMPAMSPVVRFRNKDYLVNTLEIANAICKKIAENNE